MTATIATISLATGVISQEQSVLADSAPNQYTFPVVDQEKEINNQQNNIDYAKYHVDIAQNNVNIAQADANRTDRIAKESTPQALNETRNSIETLKAQITDVQSRKQEIEQQQNDNLAIIEDCDRATDEYEEACQKEIDAEKIYNAAQYAYYTAETTEKQDVALGILKSIGIPYSDAIFNRREKEAIVRLKTPAADKARANWAENVDELTNLALDLSSKNSLLVQMNTKLDLMTNAIENKKKLDNNLKQKLIELKDAKTYLEIQETKLENLKNKYAGKNKNENTELNGEATDVKGAEDSAKVELEAGQDKVEVKTIEDIKGQAELPETLSEKNIMSEQKTGSLKIVSGTNESQEASQVNAVKTSIPKSTRDNEGKCLPQTSNEMSVSEIIVGTFVALFGFGLGFKKKQFN